MPSITCRVVLGLDRSATKQQVKQVYRALSMVNHPDRGGNITEFMRVAAA
jgi:curved DNA-binding protein CbpA